MDKKNKILRLTTEKISKIYITKGNEKESEKVFNKEGIPKKSINTK